jgi:hypothetical protein
MSLLARLGIGASGRGLFGGLVVACSLFGCSRTGLDDGDADASSVLPVVTQDGAAPPIDDGGGADEEGDARDDANADANPNPPPGAQIAACGGTCGGVTLASTGNVTLAELGGRWVFCGGQLPSLSLYWDGFPPDTAGFDFDPHTSVATLLVASADGGLEPGVGEQYTWPVSVSYGDSGLTYTGLLFNFTNAFSAAWAPLAPTLFPSADGCTASLDLVLYTGEIPNFESNWTFAGDP